MYGCLLKFRGDSSTKTRRVLPQVPLATIAVELSSLVNENRHALIQDKCTLAGELTEIKKTKKSIANT